MKQVSLFAFLLAFAASPVWAQEIPAQEVPSFAEADANSDGMLSIDEAEQALPVEVVIVDTNNDGTLNKSEAAEALPELSFSSDSDGSAAVDEEAYQQIVQSLQGESGDPES